MGTLLHEGDQLELELAGPGLAWREPWGGVAPRVLTRTFVKFSLGAHTPGGSATGYESRSEVKGSSAVQLDLFL